MSRLIWKYSFTDGKDISIDWGLGSRVVHVAQQHRDAILPSVWAEHASPMEALPERRLRMVGTGHPFDLDEGKWEHVGSAVCSNYVWHVYLGPSFMLGDNA